MSVMSELRGFRVACTAAAALADMLLPDSMLEPLPTVSYEADLSEEELAEWERVTMGE